VHGTHGYGCLATSHRIDYLRYNAIVQVKLETVGDWHALRGNTEQVAELVSEFLRGLGTPDTNWSPVASGSCLNVQTGLGFLKIFSPFEDEVETRECLGLQLLAGPATAIRSTRSAWELLSRNARTEGRGLALSRWRLKSVNEIGQD
jgi:hypothetical protein